MKKIWLALTICFAVLFVFNGCGETETGAPENLEIEAANDGLQVVLSWEAPDADEPDGYIIYFRPVGTADWLVGDTVDALTYTHDPYEETGDYRIASYYGEDEFNSDIVTTEPVYTAAVVVSELNAAGNAGYGWNISTDFKGTSYSMAEAANIPNVDFYVSNWNLDMVTLPYGIWAPDQAESDPGNTGFVPTGSWKLTAIGKELINDPQAALPAHTTTNYAQYVDMDAFPAYVAIYTTAGYYALIEVAAQPNTTEGTINVESWFQTVEGLRLIAH